MGGTFRTFPRQKMGGTFRTFGGTFRTFWWHFPHVLFPHFLLDRAGEFVVVNVSEDPPYHVATDRLG